MSSKILLNYFTRFIQHGIYYETLIFEDQKYTIRNGNKTLIFDIARALVTKGKRRFTIRTKKFQLLWYKILRLSEDYIFPSTPEGRVCALLYVHIKRNVKIDCPIVNHKIIC